MLSELIFVFLITMLISAGGNAMPGLVNIRVIETALYKNWKDALLLASGAETAELFYAAMATLSVAYLNNFPEVIKWCHFLMIPVFAGMSMFYFTRKAKSVSFAPARHGSSTNIFLQGVLIGFVNPQMFPFWFTNLLYIQGVIAFNHDTTYYVFVLAAVTGGYSMLLLLGWLSVSFRQRLLHFFNKYDFNRIAAIAFIVLCLWKMLDVYSRYLQPATFGDQ